MGLGGQSHPDQTPDCVGTRWKAAAPFINVLLPLQLKSQPLDREELREKFLMVTRHCRASAMEETFDRLQNLEHEADLDWIGVCGP